VKIEILDGQIVKECPSFQEKSFLGTVAAIAALIPAFIIGVVVKLFAVLFTKYSEDKALVEQFFQREIRLPEAPTGITLEAFRGQIALQAEPVLARIGSEESIWQDEGFIQEYSQVLEEYFTFMQLYFKDLEEESHHDVQAMRDRMIVQPQNRASRGFDINGQDYSYSFFPFSSLYHFARSCAIRYDRAEYASQMGIGDDEEMPLREKFELTEADQEPYFNPTKPQYRWRQLYNAFCAKVDENGLRSLLESRDGDTRFSNWSRPDLVMVKNYYNPDTMPT